MVASSCKCLSELCINVAPHRYTAKTNRCYTIHGPRVVRNATTMAGLSTAATTTTTTTTTGTTTSTLTNDGTITSTLYISKCQLILQHAQIFPKTSMARSLRI